MSEPDCAIRILHLFPDLLNLYGDRGNVMCIERRCRWRGIGTEVVECRLGQHVDFSAADLVFLGGGSDREEAIVCDALLAVRNELVGFVERGGALLAVCGGYQLLGRGYLLGTERVPGIGLFDADTTRGEGRLVGNVVIETDVCDMPVVGYENHAGRTVLGPSATPLGRVVRGYGNDGESGYEGAILNSAVGTYLHGPVLPKNPQLADWLIARAISYATGAGEVRLDPLDDAEEIAANEATQRLP